VINPSSIRVQGGVAVDFVRRLPEFSGAILHDLEVLVNTVVVFCSRVGDDAPAQIDVGLIDEFWVL
jgi:hypothetical protein